MHEALDLVRHADQRVHRLAVAGARELQRQREAEIGNERERMRRIDRERRQHREDGGQEILLQPVMLLLGHVLRIDDDDAVRRRVPGAVRASAPAGRWPAPRPPRRCAQAVRTASGRPGSGRRRPRAPGPSAPATRTMKNSSRLLAEIDRKRSFSSSGWLGLAASSSTRRLKCSQDNSRLMKRSGLSASLGKGAAGARSAEPDSAFRTMASSSIIHVRKSRKRTS